MDQKLTLRMVEDEKDEERLPLNAMVAGNLKDIIIRKIYRDVESSSAPPKKVSPLFRQYLTAVGPVIGTLSCGMAAGYSAILLPQLSDENTEIAITKDEGSWIASLLALPLIFGCLVSGYLLDLLGRKMSQVAACVPFTVGWIVLALSPNITGLYAGRFITGFCVGLLSPAVQVFIAETSQPDCRGVLLSGSSLAVALGIFLSHVIGTFCTWRFTACVSCVPPVICTFFLLYVRESPVWLIQKGRIKEAEDAFRWLRGDSEEARKEFNDLLIKRKDVDCQGAVSTMNSCLKSSFLKPFFVLNFFFFVQQFSGVNAVAFYSINILKKIMANVNEYFCTVIIDVVRFVASIIAVFLLKKFGRKQLSVASAIGTALSLFALAVYLGCMNLYMNLKVDSGQLLDGTSDSGALNETTAATNTAEKSATDAFYSYILNYLPLVFLILYICFVSIGLVPIPWVLTGELFSKEVRGIGSGGTSSFGFLFYFIVVKLTPDLFEKLDDYGTFCLFGIICIIGSIVLWLYMPETKDKTLAEIEAFYTSEKPLHLRQNFTTQI